jgi:glycosyltransferase involved in cell wall biosynthesis
MKITLSILILTIEGRESFYNNLIASIAKQIKESNLRTDVEVLVSKDVRGQNTIGSKRNTLLKQANGIYAMFIDDDDMLANGSLPLIIEKLKSENPDVLLLEGVLTTDGNNPQTFIHSLKIKEWYEHDGVYYRPPNHLNPIRTSISKDFAFPEINHGEDKAWSMAICNANVLKTESTINMPYYFYQFLSNK